MRHTRYYLLGAALGALCCLTMGYGHAQEAGAQEQAATRHSATPVAAPPDAVGTAVNAGGGPQSGDPARWYVADTTKSAQLRTKRKEIGAALQEAQADCKRVAAAERATCLKQARATHDDDMRAAAAP
ncbi:MAG: hypothetical protein V4754_04875 [Pseudomonadota bacterium]